MSISRKLAAGGLAAVVAVVLMGGFLASTAEAQPALPYKAYGSGLRVGQVVVALKGATQVGTATVDGSGNWQMDIPVGTAVAGDVITFTLDGRLTTSTIVFASGQFPAPPGLALVQSSATPVPTTVPGPGKTGNAGLADAGSRTSMLLMLVLGAGVLVAAAGARAVARQR